MSVGLPKQKVTALEMAAPDDLTAKFIRLISAVHPSSMTALELMRAMGLLSKSPSEAKEFQASVRFHNIRIKADSVLRSHGLVVERDGGQISSKYWLSAGG